MINTTGTGLPPNVKGDSPGRFLTQGYNGTLDIEHCDLENTAGIEIDGPGGSGPQSSGRVKIPYNHIHNIDGRLSDGTGGWLRDSDNHTHVPRQFVMINHAFLPGAEVAWNQVINDPYNSRVEDNINILNGGGALGNSLLIHDNYIQGEYSQDPTDNAQFNTGSGINAADGGTEDGTNGNLPTAYVHAFNNQVVSIQNYGIGINAGHDNEVDHNRVVSCGLLPDRTPFASANLNNMVGMQVLNVYSSPVFYNNYAHDNVIGLLMPNGSRSDYSIAGVASNTADHNNYNNNSLNLPGPPVGQNGSTIPITLQDEAAEFRSWAQKLSSSSVAVGNNYLINPGFETGDLSHWILYDGGNNSTLFPEYLGTGVEHNGTYHLAMWHGTAYEAYASQIATSYQGASLPSGTYTASAWVQSTGINTNNAGDAVEMYVYQYDANGGGYMAVPVPTTGASRGDWRQVMISNIPVSGGKCEVGFHIKDSSGNHWLRVDDVQLYDPLKAPSVPTGVKAVAGAVGTKKVTLSWNKVAGASSYKVYRSSSSRGTYSQIGTATVLSYVNTGLTAGTTYYYKVSAANAAGTSGQSAAVSAKAQ